MRSVRQLFGVIVVLLLIVSAGERAQAAPGPAMPITAATPAIEMVDDLRVLDDVFVRGRSPAVTGSGAEAKRAGENRRQVFRQLRSDLTTTLEISFSGDDEHDAVGFLPTAFSSRLPVVSAVPEPLTRALPGVALVLLAVPRA